MNKSSVGRGAASVEEGGKVFCILRFFFFFCTPGRCLRDTGAD